MPTYSISAINVGSFNLGESDKVVTLFSAERGLVKAVAKGARKPGAKIGGRAELLAVNRLLLATGKTFDIITQAEGIKTFKNLRNDLTRLSYALYYAELTCYLGQGVSDETALYFEILINSLQQLSMPENNPEQLCLIFQLSLLNMLGLKPELNSCVMCRKRLQENDISVFHHDLGGVMCDMCFSSHIPVSNKRSALKLAESPGAGSSHRDSYFSNLSSDFTYLTPLVWKKLILADHRSASVDAANANLISGQSGNIQSEIIEKATMAARHLLEAYIEHRSGRKMKALALI